MKGPHLKSPHQHAHNRGKSRKNQESAHNCKSKILLGLQRHGGTLMSGELQRMAQALWETAARRRVGRVVVCAKQQPEHTEPCLTAGNDHLGGNGYIFRQLEADSRLQALVPAGDIHQPLEESLVLSEARHLMTQATERAEVFSAFVPCSLGLPSPCAQRQSLWECSTTRKIKGGIAEASWIRTSRWHQTGYKRGGRLMSL